MSSKNVCLGCKLSYNGASAYNSELSERACPKCGALMISMPHRFRPPRKSDEEGWRTVKYLVDNGFKYNHVYEVIPDNANKATRTVKVPSNLREAKDFLDKIYSERQA
jgi:hypothetical protein